MFVFTLYYQPVPVPETALMLWGNKVNNKEVIMIPRIELSEEKKQRIIDKAGHLGGGEAKKSYGA